MESDKSQAVKESIVLGSQYLAFLLGFIPFFLEPSLFTNKYALLGYCAILAYIGMSSIVARVSIIRRKGTLAHTRGSKARQYGIIALIIVLILAIVILLLPEQFFSFLPVFRKINGGFCLTW